MYACIKVIRTPLEVDKGAVGTLAKKLPLIVKESVQTLDRQWRCLLIDTDMDKEWSTKTMEEFYGHLVTIDCYKELGLFVMNVLALPQSTAGVERTFSKVTLNKTKLRNSLHISTLESILVTSENFKENFESDNKLKTLHGQAGNKYFSKYLESDSNNIEFD